LDGGDQCGLPLPGECLMVHTRHRKFEGVPSVFRSADTALEVPASKKHTAHRRLDTAAAI
jgi:hypothetical protein